jgi:hypothetical protein
MSQVVDCLSEYLIQGLRYFYGFAYRTHDQSDVSWLVRQKFLDLVQNLLFPIGSAYWRPIERMVCH